MPPETEAPTGQRESSVAKAKEFFGLLREFSIAFCIALFFFLLLCWPETVKDRLRRAGITEVAGVHFDTKQVEAAVQKTGDVQQQVAEIKQNVEATKQDLADLHAQANPETQQKLEAINTRLDASLATAQAAQQVLQVSRQQQEDILQQARPLASVQQQTGSWGVVVSSDKQTLPAVFEVKLVGESAKESGGTAVNLYDKQGWLRTVVEFPSNTQAQAALPALRQTKKQRYVGAYVVNIDEWCPNRQLQQGAVVTTYKCP